MATDPHLLILQDAHHAAYLEDLGYWLSLAERFGGPILELGCGTGRVFLPLHEAGFSVYGIDVEPAAILLLRQKLQKTGGDPASVIQADMASFHLPNQFNLIICPCNTFSTLNSPTRGRTLGVIQSHLAPDGCFAASIPNPELLYDLRSQPEPVLEGDFRHPLSGDPVQVSSSYVRRGDTFTLAWHYDHLLPDGHVRRASVHVDHEIHPLPIYQTELHAAGLEITHVWGDFDRRDYSTASPHLIWEAVKQEKEPD
jgi:SAM-dependent methyltransferase